MSQRAAYSFNLRSFDPMESSKVFSSELEIKVFASFNLVTMKEVQITTTTQAWNICDLKYNRSRTQRFQLRAQMELFENLKVIILIMN